MLRMKFLVFLISILSVVISRSHHNSVNDDSYDVIDNARVEDDDNFLNQISELDHMINLVRRARSVPEADNDIVGEDLMVEVMDQIDLTIPDNVEIVADVMKSLSGEKQLEFLMNKFMMHDDEIKRSMVEPSSRSTEPVTSLHSSDKVKREAQPYGGGSGRISQFDSFDTHGKNFGVIYSMYHTMSLYDWLYQERDIFLICIEIQLEEVKLKSLAFCNSLFLCYSLSLGLMVMCI